MKLGNFKFISQGMMNFEQITSVFSTLADNSTGDLYERLNVEIK